MYLKNSPHYQLTISLYQWVRIFIHSNKKLNSTVESCVAEAPWRNSFIHSCGTFSWRWKSHSDSKMKTKGCFTRDFPLDLHGNVCPKCLSTSARSAFSLKLLRSLGECISKLTVPHQKCLNIEKIVSTLSGIGRSRTHNPITPSLG